MKKIIILTAILSSLSLASCSFIPDLQNNQDNTSSSIDVFVSDDSNSVPETTTPIIEDITNSESTTEITEETSVITPNIPPAESLVNDFNDCKTQYVERISKCLQSMQKTTSPNLIVADNQLSSTDPFWDAMVDEISEMDVNPVEVASKIGMLPSETENISTYESEFIPFVYEPIFGNAEDYSHLKPNQILAVIAEKTFNVPSKDIRGGYIDDQNLYYTYIISNVNPDYSIICALYAYVDGEKITRLGIESFAREYSKNISAENCPKSICDINNIPTEDSFNDTYIIPEHKKMCDIAATVVSSSYYYQRSSAKFVSINDSPSFLDDANHNHIRSIHYVSWFNLT